MRYPMLRRRLAPRLKMGNHMTGDTFFMDQPVRTKLSNICGTFMGRYDYLGSTEMKRRPLALVN